MAHPKPKLEDVAREILAREEKMSLSKKLQSLPALVLEGFVAGGILFFTLQPIAAEREAPAAPSNEPSVLSTLQV